jgi:hypothetical protein
MKAELSKYPIDSRVIEDLNVFMIVHQFESVQALINKTDEALCQMEGFSTHLLMAVLKIREHITLSVYSKD